MISLWQSHQTQLHFPAVKGTICITLWIDKHKQQSDLDFLDFHTVCRGLFFFLPPARYMLTSSVISPRFGFRTAEHDTKSSRRRAASLRALRCPGCLRRCQMISTIHRSAAPTDRIYSLYTVTWTVSVRSYCYVPLSLRLKSRMVPVSQFPIRLSP